MRIPKSEKKLVNIMFLGRKWIDEGSQVDIIYTLYLDFQKVFDKNKMIPELRDVSYEECLKEGGLTTIEPRRSRGDQIGVFKILNGYENIDRNVFFSLKVKPKALCQAFAPIRVLKN